MDRGEIAQAIVIGVLATGWMDGVAALRRRLFGVRGLNYAWIGRWVLGLWRGLWRGLCLGQVAWVRPDIATAPEMRGEIALGWGLHYGIGGLLSLGLLGLSGPEWMAGHLPVLPVLYGAVTVVVPFLTLQPAFGLGIAARRAPAPWAMRRRSLLTHVIFGLGLMIGAQIVSRL